MFTATNSSASSLALCLFLVGFMGACASGPILPHDQSGSLTLGQNLDGIDGFIKSSRCLKYDDKGEPILKQCPAVIAAIMESPDPVELTGLPTEHHRGYFDATLGIDEFKAQASKGLIYLHDTLLFGGTRFKIRDFSTLSFRQRHELRTFCDSPERNRWSGVVEEVFAGCSYSQAIASSEADMEEVRMVDNFVHENRAGSGSFLDRDSSSPWDHSGRGCDQKAAVSVNILKISELCQDHVKHVAPEPCEITLQSDRDEPVLLADNGHEIRRGCDSLLGATNALLSITLSPTIIADASNFRKGDGSKAERRITFEFAKVDSWETKIEKSWSWRGQKAVSKEGRPLSDTALYQVTLQFKVPVDPKTGAFGFKIRAKECKWGKDAQCAVPANLLLRASPF